MPRYNDYDFSLLEHVKKVTADTEVTPIYNEDKPLVVEVGCGNGHFLTSLSNRNQDCVFCGIDIKSQRIIRCMEKVKKSNLQNIFFVCGDAMNVLEKCFDDEQIEKIYMTFPDPWPKTRHHKNRLFKPDFLDIVWEKLKFGGTFVFITDFEEYFIWSRNFVEADNRYAISTSGTIDIDGNNEFLTQSLFGEKWKRQRKSFYLLEFTKK